MIRKIAGVLVAWLGLAALYAHHEAGWHWVFLTTGYILTFIGGTIVGTNDRG